MSNIKHENQNKKGRLGRGLGSLLGGATGADESDQSVELSPPPRSEVSLESLKAGAGATIAGESVPSASHLTSTTTVQAPKIPEEAQIWKIQVDRLRPNSQQPRQVFQAEALKELTASIKEKGILQPIVARRIDERTFEIIAGERRWRAAQAAGLHEVPVILKKVSEQDSLELAIIENIQRENLNPLEESEAYDRLMLDYSLTQQQVADKVGKDRVTVANSLRLLMLPREVKDMLRKGEISSGHAKVILSVENPLDQIMLAKRAVSEKLSVRATEKLVAQIKNPSLNNATVAKSDDRANLSDRLANELAAELQKLLGTKVGIDYARGKGRLSLHFYSDEELNSLADKIRSGCKR